MFSRSDAALFATRHQKVNAELGVNLYNHVVNSDLTLALVIVTALSFDFTNGFHDTGNAMATSIATGALPPRVAVLLSGALNLVGAFLSLAWRRPSPAASSTRGPST